MEIIILEIGLEVIKMVMVNINIKMVQYMKAIGNKIYFMVMVF